MSFIGNQTLVLLNQYNIQAWLNNAEIEKTIDQLDATVYGQTSRSFVRGDKSGSVSFEGFSAATADEIDNIINGVVGVDSQVLTLVLQNDLSGFPLAYLFDVSISSLTTTASRSDLLRLAAAFLPSGRVLLGNRLNTHQAYTSSANGAALDGNAATTTGAVAHLHVTANGGTGDQTLDVTIEDSADGSSGWTTIGTFTQVTTTNTKQRLTIAGTVRRYTRVVYSIAGSGSPSYTFSAYIART